MTNIGHESFSLSWFSGVFMTVYLVICDDHLLHNQEKHKQIVYFVYDGLLWYVKKCFGHPEDVESDKILEKIGLLQKGAKITRINC